MSIGGLRIAGGNGVGKQLQLLGFASMSCACWVSSVASIVLTFCYLVWRTWALQPTVCVRLVGGGIWFVAMRQMLGEGGSNRDVV